MIARATKKMIKNDKLTCGMMVSPSECFIHCFGPVETPVLFIAMHNYYRDDTAWIAIANVMRQQKREEWLKNHPKLERVKKDHVPRPPVDVNRILKSEHKVVYINKAEWIYQKMLREIERGNN